MSLFGSVFPIGAMIGPIFGGLFVKYWSWRGVFFVNVPLGLLILALAWRFIPRDPAKDRSTGLTMDWVGMGLMGAAVLAAMFSTNALGAPGGDGGPWGFWALLAGATLATGLFVRHVRGASTPFIAPSLIWGSGFGPVNAVNAIYGGMTIGAVALVPLYAANRYGMDALAAGTLLIAQGIAAIALSLAATWALRRTGYRRPMWVGACAIVAGLGVLAVQAPVAIGPYRWLLGGAFLVGAGIGAVNPASRNAGLQLAPRSASTLAALRTLFLQLGTIATVAVATAVLADAHDPGRAQAWVYAAQALLLLLALPLIHRVPEHRGAW